MVAPTESFLDIQLKLTNVPPEAKRCSWAVQLVYDSMESSGDMPGGTEGSGDLPGGLATADRYLSILSLNRKFFDSEGRVPVRVRFEKAAVSYNRVDGVSPLRPPTLDARSVWTEI